jgi:hypothetical protein
VKSFPPLTAFLATAFCACANAQSWQEVSSHVFTDAAVIWQIPTNQIPKSLWVYRRLLPHIFPPGVISNAVVLGSLQSRGFPPSTTNDFYLPQQVPENWPGTIPTLLGIRPCDAYLYYTIPAYGAISPKEVPNDDTIMRAARKTAPLLGLDPANLEHGKIYTHSCVIDQAVNTFCGRGVFFPRYLDGISFFSAADDGESAEGFSMEFGEGGKIQAFSLRWSDVERAKYERTASPSEMARCIQTHHVIVLPNFKEDDFARLRKLATATKLTVTKITPYYGEGMFGEAPANDVPPEFITPFAELEAMAELNNTNTIVRLLCPILADDAKRLLETKNK